MILSNLDAFALLTHREHTNLIWSKKNIMAQIQLFRDSNCSGVASQIIEQDFANLDGFRNDNISSVRIASGEWMLCSDVDYSGVCITIGPGDHNMEGRFNDVVSSLKATIR